MKCQRCAITMATFAAPAACAVYHLANGPHTYPAMMFLVAKATDQELAPMVTYLSAEDKILRARLPYRINVTAEGTVAPTAFRPTPRIRHPQRGDDGLAGNPANRGVHAR